MKAFIYRRFEGVGYQNAMPIIEKAAKLAKENLATDDILLSRVYRSLGHFHHHTGDFFNARSIIDTSMHLYKGASMSDQDLFELISEYKYYTYSYSNGSTDTLITYLDFRYQREIRRDESDPYDVLYILQDFPDIVYENWRL